MATGSTIGWRVLRARRKGQDWGHLKDLHVLAPTEVRDPIAPNWPVAKLILLPEAGHSWDWGRWLRIDDRLAIVSDHVDLADRIILFDGYVIEGGCEFDRNENLIVTAVGRPFRLAHDRGYQVYGRVQLSKAGDATLYPALPCVFNPGGRPNCGGKHAQADQPDQPDQWVFCDPSNPSARLWTAIAAIEYLLLTYNADETYIANPTFTRFERDNSPTIQVDVDGLSLLAAIAKIGDHAGYDVSESITSSDNVDDGIEGEIDHTLAVTRRGEGELVTIRHQPTRDGVMEVLDTRRTNLFAARLAHTAASSVPAPVVLGGRDLFEITIPLYPAWANASSGDWPEGLAVVNPGNELASTSDTYVKRYCTIGDEHADYAEVGRLWDANSDDKYAWATVPDMAALAGQAAGSWPKMPYKTRRLLTKLGASKFAAGAEVFLEYRYFEGSWNRLTKFKHFPDRLAIYLPMVNVAEILPPDGVVKTDDFFTKLMTGYGNVEMRLTCTVSSPHRRVLTPGQPTRTGTRFAQSAQFDKGPLGQRRTRAASSRFYSKNIDTGRDVGPAADVIDTKSMKYVDRLAVEANRIQAINADRFIESSLTLEYIAPAAVPLAGQVRRLGGIGINLATNAGVAIRYPRIVRRVFRLQSGQMDLILDTDRQAVVT